MATEVVSDIESFSRSRRFDILHALCGTLRKLGKEFVCEFTLLDLRKLMGSSGSRVGEIQVILQSRQ
ncbi:MAG: hypothetical protein ACNA8G_12790, partial [Gammaproteobacteria bacterium]